MPRPYAPPPVITISASDEHTEAAASTTMNPAAHDQQQDQPRTTLAVNSTEAASKGAMHGTSSTLLSQASALRSDMQKAKQSADSHEAAF